VPDLQTGDIIVVKYTDSGDPASYPTPTTESPTDLRRIDAEDH
jgi:hypothetical protein